MFFLRRDYWQLPWETILEGSFRALRSPASLAKETPTMSGPTEVPNPEAAAFSWPARQETGRRDPTRPAPPHLTWPWPPSRSLTAEERRRALSPADLRPVPKSSIDVGQHSPTIPTSHPTIQRRKSIRSGSPHASLITWQLSREET